MKSSKSTPIRSIEQPPNVNAALQLFAEATVLFVRTSREMGALQAPTYLTDAWCATALLAIFRTEFLQPLQSSWNASMQEYVQYIHREPSLAFPDTTRKIINRARDILFQYKEKHGVSVTSGQLLSNKIRRTSVFKLTGWFDTNEDLEKGVNVRAMCVQYDAAITAFYVLVHFSLKDRELNDAQIEEFRFWIEKVLVVL